MALSTNGVVLEGHHRCRVALEFGESVTLPVSDAEVEKGLPIAFSNYARSHIHGLKAFASQLQIKLFG